MESREFDQNEMVLLYNPAAEHRCKLPKLNVLNQYLPVEPYTIMECDQCAQRWWAHVDYGDCRKNKWRKLRWYHWVLRSKIA
jgi:hypothetical protein